MPLSEKINYEFRNFYLDMMRTSKENIFAHSNEIEIKKKLLLELLSITQKVDDHTEKLLSLQSNVIESAYCFLIDIQKKHDVQDVGEAVKCWLEFLQKKSKRE